jgi:hypothetical protein
LVLKGGNALSLTYGISRGVHSLHRYVYLCRDDRN